MNKLFDGNNGQFLTEFINTPFLNCENVYLTNPFENILTDVNGKNVYAQNGGRHNGIDLVPKKNPEKNRLEQEMIFALRSGKVLKIGWTQWNGNYVCIAGDGVAIYYLHFKWPLNFKTGEFIAAKQHLGWMGATGLSIGQNPEHLHICYVFVDENNCRMYRDNGMDGWRNPIYLLGLQA